MCACLGACVGEGGCVGGVCVRMLPFACVDACVWVCACVVARVCVCV